MIDKNKYSIQVQKYLGNELTQEEKSSFEILLQEDKLLAKELKMQLAVDNAISEPGLEQFKIFLEKLHFKHLGGARGSTYLGFNSYISLVACCILVFTVASILIYDSVQKKSLNDFFEEYYKPYEISIVKRYHTSDLSRNRKIGKLIHYYNIGDFELASQVISNNIMDLSINHQLILISGLIHLELNNYDLAKNEFNKILNSNDNLLREDALWYLSLTYFKGNEKDLAIKSLKLIVDGNSFYSKIASKLLSEVEEFN